MIDGLHVGDRRGEPLLEQALPANRFGKGVVMDFPAAFAPDRNSTTNVAMNSVQKNFSPACASEVGILNSVLFGLARTISCAVPHAAGGNAVKETP